MSPSTTIFLSLLVALALAGGITSFVTSLVRRSPNTATRAAEHDGVAFVVCNRRWQSALFQWFGLALLALGCVLILLDIFGGGASDGLSGVGVVFVLLGFLILWISHGIRRSRIEVTADSIWVYRWRGAPRQFAVDDITALRTLRSNNYGGLVAHAKRRRVFSANRLMLGYPQLIRYLAERRPDLALPPGSHPF